MNGWMERSSDDNRRRCFHGIRGGYWHVNFNAIDVNCVGEEMTDDKKLKFYFSELLGRYQQLKAARLKSGDSDQELYIAGECAGLDYAIETLKTVFEIAEKE